MKREREGGREPSRALRGRHPRPVLLCPVLLYLSANLVRLVQCSAVSHMTPVLSFPLPLRANIDTAGVGVGAALCHTRVILFCYLLSCLLLFDLRPLPLRWIFLAFLFYILLCPTIHRFSSYSTLSLSLPLNLYMFRMCTYRAYSRTCSPTPWLIPYHTIYLHLLFDALADLE